VVVDATERLRRIKSEGQIDWNKLEGGRWDKHPSWFSHQIIAEDLKQALLRNGLIPVR
jgi:hypothetical protein